MFTVVYFIIVVLLYFFSKTKYSEGGDMGNSLLSFRNLAPSL